MSLKLFSNLQDPVTLFSNQQDRPPALAPCDKPQGVGYPVDTPLETPTHGKARALPKRLRLVHVQRSPSYPSLLQGLS